MLNLKMGDEKMIRKIFKFFLVIIIISYGLWLLYNQLFPKINSIHSRGIYIENLSKLEDLAEDIVRVRPIGKKKQVLHFSGKLGVIQLLKLKYLKPINLSI
jgi:hypothetical protein